MSVSRPRSPTSVSTNVRCSRKSSSASSRAMRSTTAAPASPRAAPSQNAASRRKSRTWPGLTNSTSAASAAPSPCSASAGSACSRGRCFLPSVRAGAPSRTSWAIRATLCAGATPDSQYTGRLPASTVQRSSVNATRVMSLPRLRTRITSRRVPSLMPCELWMSPSSSSTQRPTSPSPQRLPRPSREATAGTLHAIQSGPLSAR